MMVLQIAKISILRENDYYMKLTEKDDNIGFWTGSRNTAISANAQQ